MASSSGEPIDQEKESTDKTERPSTSETAGSENITEDAPQASQAETSSTSQAADQPPVVEVKKRFNLRASTPEVESVEQQQGLQIHVFCKKRPGLLETLVAALEGVGLTLLEANISAYSHVILDAFGVQETGELIDAAMLQSFLLDIIAYIDQPANGSGDSGEPKQ